MSIRAIDWAFNQKCKNPAQKLVLIKLADNANDEGGCWPSLSYMAEHCDMSRSSISEHCKALADLGLVEIVPRFKDGVQLPNYYKLKIPMKSGVRPTEHRSVASEGGVRPTERGCSVASEPEPSYKPSIKSKKASGNYFDQFEEWKKEASNTNPLQSVIELAQLKKMPSH